MRRRMTLLALAALVLLISAGMALAQANGGAALGGRPAHGVTSQGGPYDLSWWTVDGGGTTSGGGGGYALGGTAGQPEAAVWTGGGYTLAGGFWGGAAAAEFGIYLPLVLRGG